jgi:hypothetical protein
MTQERPHPSPGLERLESILGRVFPEVVRRAVREKRPSDQDSTSAREAEGASVARDQTAMPRVGRLATAGAAWVRALRVLARDEQDAVLREMEQFLLEDARLSDERL